jgi:hypothetical protein
MFSWLKWIQDIQKRKTVEDFCKEWKFKLYGNYGFAVDGLMVSEFGYLLRYVTHGKHVSFEDFAAIANDFVAIDNAIVTEMAKPTPKEAEVNFTTPEGARRNLENLRYIIKAITKYVELANHLGHPVNPLLENK